jgi:methionine--tRNA ligase beta chain
MTDTPETPAGGAEESAEAKSNFKPTITYDDFAKLDLRVAKITEASPHPNADRLLVLKIDLGCETRQLIAGIRGAYEPESLIGKSIVVVANLAPRKMRGLESQGMLIAAVPTDDAGEKTDVIVLTTDRDAPAGASCS